MTTRYTSLATVALLFVLTGLGGCLTKSESPGFTGDGTQGSGDGSSNQAPTISGNPAPSVLVGDIYSFTPSASDADGDALSFSVDNLPAWARFDAQTGTISGAPTLADIGISSNITIRVSDGKVTSSLLPFALEVTQSALGSIALSWAPPTENQDGSVLTDLAGFRIYYGRNSGEYTNVISIDNPTVTDYLVEDLTPSTYYFAATAVNAAGMESGFSGEAVRLVN